MVFSTTSSSKVAVGTSGTVTITGTNFSGNGGTWSAVGTGDADLTLSGTETSSTTTLTGTFKETEVANTDIGATTLNLTDNGVTTDDLGSVTVVAAPKTTGATPSLLGLSQGATTVTLTNDGTGLYETGATVTATNGAGQSLVVGSTTVAATGDSLTVSITPTNAVTGAAAATGAYTIKVKNPDGGADLGSATITVATATVTSMSPSDIANDDVGPSSTENVTLTGSGLTPAVTITTPTACGTGGELAWTHVTYVNSTTVTATLTVTDESTGAAVCSPVVTYDGTNDAAVAAGLIGLGEASSVAPTVTGSSSTSTAPLTAGSAQEITLTGTGFGQYSVPEFTDGNGNVDANLTLGAVSDVEGTSLSFSVTAATGVIAGVDSVTVSGSNSFADGLYVAGPTITAQSPAAIADDAPVGTVITLTGTGFTSAIDGLVTLRAAGPEALLTYVSPTSATLTLATALSNADDSNALTDTYPDTVSVTVAGNTSAAFGLTIDPSPTVTDAALTYATSNTSDGVGVGATATPVTITGTGFQTGATVTKFTSPTGTADSNVTFTVKSVSANGDTISGTVAVASGDTNSAVGYTVTNPDGGTATVTGIEASAIKIDKAPVISAVSPTTGNAGVPTTFTITGTGFTAASTVSLSSDGTCGPATFATPTSTSATLTATCTIGEAPTAAVSILVTNVDGGTASAVVLPLVTPPPAFHVSGAHGTAIAGKTVTMTISGTGFYGQPKITSNAAGTKVGVSKDTGTSLTIRVTTKKGVSGEHTFTIRLANGKSAKANYSIKK